MYMSVTFNWYILTLDTSHCMEGRYSVYSWQTILVVDPLFTEKKLEPTLLSPHYSAPDYPVRGLAEVRRAAVSSPGVLGCYV